MEELLKTSKRLKSCLDEYLGACSVIATSHDLTGERGTPLLNGIEQELQTVAAYETDILNANSILAQKRNSSPALVPINALSPEILEWIFQLAYRSWLFNMDIRLPYPMFPETLTHVCSRWRQVALGSQSLWSRVNVPIFNRSYELLISRGETFASRVAPSVLDVHILTANRDVFTPYLHRKLDQFCASSGAKIRSLQLTNGIKSATYDLYLESLIQASFPHIVPGTLRHLGLVDYYPLRRGFVGSTEAIRYTYPFVRLEISIKLSQRQLDEILRPIQSLWLRNVFFSWESPAYCGLVDLRLLISGSSKYGDVSIESSQLREILSACPGLRTFYCHIEVKRSVMDVEGPVYLADLEELNLRQITSEHHESILPLLLPGQKPLSLSIQAKWENPYTEVDQDENLFSTPVLDFFKRSNVTALFIRNRSFSRGLWLKSLLMDSPASVRIIGLQSFTLDDMTGLTNLEQPCLTRLDCLDLMSCYFKVETLRELARVCPIQVLKLLVNTEKAQTLNELAAIFPVVKCVDSSASIEEWNSGEIWDWDWELP
ncbi:putative F-box-like domain protein [Rhizoctonia solani 123E]|uniref:Putative F-box-like domain protein n=1 Tax=Rhizoctonia solani 123E TaxID=1423351 RepID=A0A074SC08_9AGAM|nr:putative F-box-like domain protein [Rhizoctonia solani 123E]